MIKRKLGRYYGHPFTWLTVVSTLPETWQRIQEIYDDLVNKYKYVNKTNDTSSPFYGWELKKENIGVYISFDFDALSIILSPKSDQGDYFYDWDSGFGVQWYIALINDVGGKPSYPEFVKAIEYLLSPIRDKVGPVDYWEVEDYCKGGRGYIVLTEDINPHQPLKAEMRKMGLITPESFLERIGRFSWRRFYHPP